MANSYAPLIFVEPDGDTITVGDPRADQGGTAPGSAPGRRVLPSADGTGATDKTAIQAAIDDAAIDGGGIVWLNGVYYINGPVNLKTGVCLRGTGWTGTVIHLTAGSNSSMIVAPADAYWYEIRDLQLDGHKESQTGGSAGIELLSDTAPDGEMASCGVPLIERVLVRYTYGHGIYSKAVEARHVNCFVFRAGGAGFYADRTDMWYTDCTAGESYSHGFHLSTNASECRLSGCKAWWPGYGAERGQFAWKTYPETLLNAAASSFYLASDNQQIVNCEAQDSAAHGFQIHSACNTIQGRAGRTEGACVAIIGGIAHRNRIDITTSSPDSIQAGLRSNPDALVTFISGGGRYNDIKVSWAPGRNEPDQWGGTAAFVQAGVTGLAGVPAPYNKVILGTPDVIANTTYAATITPDPLQGGVSVTLTGNITIANTLTNRMGPGMEFEVRLKQDATGSRTVTWGNQYVGASAIDPAANKTTMWRFLCVDAARWVQVGHASW